MDKSQNFKNAIDLIVKYIKSNEKESNNLKLGPEMEHIIVHRSDYKSVSYDEEYGIEYIFKELIKKGYEPIYEKDHILGLIKDEVTISTEPGGQFEFSLNKPKEYIKEIEDKYIEFFNILLPILDKLQYDILAIAYHPVTKIEELNLLPKKRYDSMWKYFDNSGLMGHNMMKGTAGLQLSMDFLSEEDFIKKFVVANGITNILYSIFDNGYFFEGEPAIHNIRAKIWENTDPERSGLARNAFIDNSYRGYAEYVCSTPAIFGLKDGEFYPTLDLIGDLLEREISKGKSLEDLKEEIEHYMTMVFPDVRAKKFIEIRVLDAVTYPYNFAAYALLKGIIYNEENLNFLYDKFKDISREDIISTREEMYKNGQEAMYLGLSLKDWSKKLVSLAKNGLDNSEKNYLNPLEELIENDGSFYKKTEKIYKDTEDVKKATSINKIDIYKITKDGVNIVRR